MNITISSMLSLKSNLLSDSFDVYGFIIYLLFVLLLLYAVYFSTKFIARTYSKVSGGKKIKYLEKCALSMDKAIYLVEVEGERICFYADRSTCLILKKSCVQEADGSNWEGDSESVDQRTFSQLLQSKQEDSDVTIPSKTDSGE